jgi:CRISPR-associated protein Cmr1
VLGQVRWFWRLLHADLDARELWTREGTLFGAAWCPASFGIEVVVRKRGKLLQSLPRMSDPAGYILFSARGEPSSPRNPGGTPAGEVSEGVNGTIRLFPCGGGQLEGTVVKAFRLWALLGGVGARTRRGVGAVQVEGGPPTVDELSRTLGGLVGSPVAANSPARGIRALWVGSTTHPSARQCLDALAAWYKDYRQNRRRGTRANVPRRSYWDEPEEIRKLLGTRARRHQALPPTTVHPPGWSRAVFGLPIVFQFKFEDVNNGDPPQTTLQGQRYDRMASPLLFRPVRLRPEQYVPVVALLSGPYRPPGGLTLSSAGHSYPVSLTPNPDGVFADLLPGLGGRPAQNPLGLQKVL